MGSFNQIFNAVLFFVSADILDDAALQVPHVVLDYEVPWLNGFLDVMPATDLIIVGCHAISK